MEGTLCKREDCAIKRTKEKKWNMEPGTWKCCTSLTSSLTVVTCCELELSVRVKWVKIRYLPCLTFQFSSKYVGPGIPNYFRAKRYESPPIFPRLSRLRYSSGMNLHAFGIPMSEPIKGRSTRVSGQTCEEVSRQRTEKACHSEQWRKASSPHLTLSSITRGSRSNPSPRPRLQPPPH